MPVTLPCVLCPNTSKLMFCSLWHGSTCSTSQSSHFVPSCNTGLVSKCAWIPWFPILMPNWSQLKELSFMLCQSTPPWGNIWNRFVPSKVFAKVSCTLRCASISVKEFSRRARYAWTSNKRNGEEKQAIALLKHPETMFSYWSEWSNNEVRACLQHLSLQIAIWLRHIETAFLLGWFETNCLTSSFRQMRSVSGSTWLYDCPMASKPSYLVHGSTQRLVPLAETRCAYSVDEDAWTC